jgi:DNA helicase-2/ATP-dependent DNA helicase PcrA
VALREQLATLVAASRPLGDRVHEAIDAAGLRDALRREGTSEAQGRLENLDELVAAAGEFETERGGDLAAFLDSIALVSDVDELAAPRSAVTLMTLHAAKGLEFRVVFLTGLEDGVFPHARALTDPDGLEEERRLAYVGLTRAKEHLWLSWAAQRRTGGHGGPQEPSRFLLEMPPESVVVVGRAGRMLAPEVAPAAVSGGTGDDPDDYPLRVGARVRHGRWGEGLLTGIERAGDDFVVTVTFAAVGRKRLALRYAQLEEL